MKIAVVGGNGFIGREFVAYATSRGHDITVIGSDCNVFEEEGAGRARGIIKGCDAVVLLAARRSTNDFSISDYLYNVRLADGYLSIARDEGVKNVIFTSSFSVYSGASVDWKEDEFYSPLSLYGASKQAVDSLALLYNDKYGMKIKCLRLAQVIGMGERKGYMLNTFIDNAIAGRKQTIFGRGVGRRQYIYVRDVCDAILHSAVNEGDTAGIFNIGMKDSKVHHFQYLTDNTIKDMPIIQMKH